MPDSTQKNFFVTRSEWSTQPIGPPFGLGSWAISRYRKVRGSLTRKLEFYHEGGAIWTAPTCEEAERKLETIDQYDA